jgi:SAM-dependent methyltransferase
MPINFLGYIIRTRWVNLILIKIRWPVIINELRTGNSIWETKDGWSLTGNYYSLMIEEQPSWSYYLPPYSLKRKVILDVGAGSGETARFFVNHGASRVYCCEISQEGLKGLNLNKARGKPITIIPEPFNLNMVEKIKPDFIKMDIEGYETPLLNEDLSKMPDTVLEAHNCYVIDGFKERGFKVVKRLSGDLAIMANY